MRRPPSCGPAATLRERILSLARFKPEAAPADLEIVDGRISVRGPTAKSVSLAAVAHLGNFGQGFGFIMPAEVKRGLEPLFVFRARAGRDTPAASTPACSTRPGLRTSRRRRCCP